MARVRPLPSGARGVELALEEVETALLSSLASQMIDLVGVVDDPDADPLAAMVGIDPEAAPSDDPAVRRLLPDAFMDDPDAAAEFRRFTERDLRDRKARDARTVHDDVAHAGQGSITLSIAGERLSAWLGFLNDARLVLGARLEVTEENHDELVDLPPDDPRAPLHEVYGWLTYVQDSMVQEMLEPPA